MRIQVPTECRKMEKHHNYETLQTMHFFDLFPVLVCFNYQLHRANNLGRVLQDQIGL